MEFNRTKYNVYNRNHIMMIHWMLNPGMMINELILGQRVPKVILEEKLSDKPRYERTFVPCPHCKTIHDSRTWSFSNNTGSKNWFGLYCPACENIIPCLSNLASLVVLTAAFPLLALFRKTMRERWLQKQPQRFTKIRPNLVPDPFANSGWVAYGTAFGFTMFVLNGIIFPQLCNVDFMALDIVAVLPVWLLGGLAWGYIMKIYSDTDKEDENEENNRFMEWKLKNNTNQRARLQRRRH